MMHINFALCPISEDQILRFGGTNAQGEFGGKHLIFDTKTMQYDLQDGTSAASTEKCFKCFGGCFSEDNSFISIIQDWTENIFLLQYNYAANERVSLSSLPKKIAIDFNQ